jgi:hypothetical protein
MSASFLLSLSQLAHGAGKDGWQVSAERRDVTRPEIMLLAQGVPSKDLRAVARWVESTGKPARVINEVAVALGIGLSSGEDLTGPQRGFRDRRTKVGYFFNVVTVNGRRELLLVRHLGDGGRTWVWRVNEAGDILVTVVFEDTQTNTDPIVPVPAAPHEALYQETVNVFLTSVPKP